ncbi:hypothetical protein BBW65_01590 [Helicobacter enhydrae]|uniref:Flagellar biosynthesis protein FlaG n=1 Tax=Helicobacter enhydrae TaxID=222136 RepID=A0A1B1U497_9HELI|nr:flagellar protein FlaG [Helicobacter enhydrae]ANV97580.1 hypothetical protein BBW65_01590 [Helicobacter enhydrae]
MVIQAINLNAQNKIIELAKQYTQEVKKAEPPNGDKIAQGHFEKIENDLERTNRTSKDELMKLSQDLNTKMKNLNTNVKFTYSDEIKGLLVTVRQEGSDKVIAELPSKEAIALMQKMHDLVGILFDQRG